MKNQTQKKKLPKLTKKQRGFVDDYIESENGTQSILKNYKVEGKKPEKTASVMAVENLTKPSIIEAIEVKRKSLKQALIDEGITEDYLAKKVNVLLSSEDESSVDKGLKHATNIYGVIDPYNAPKTQNTYNFIFSPETQADVKNIEDKIKARLLNKNELDKKN